MKDSEQHRATQPNLLRARCIAAALLLAPAVRSANAQVTDEVIEWLRDHAIPIQTVEPGHGFEDLEPLRQVIGDARIVALGEATHGTREFFLFRHRMLEFLVTRMGFTVFAIEADWPNTLGVNEYVLHGTGDPAEALGDMSPLEDTEETLAMIRWMRQYNDELANKQKVQFIGFDSWTGPSAVRGLIDGLQEIDPEYAKQAEADLGPLFMMWLDPADHRALPRQLRQAAHRRIRDVLRRLEEQKTAYVARSSAEHWAQVRRRAVMLQQAEERLRRSNYASASKLRERQMAENMRWILEEQGPDARILLSAHNMHVARAKQPHGYTTMGALLAEWFGDEMVVFGSTFGQGSFQAMEVSAEEEYPYRSGSPGLKVFTVDPAMPGTLDATLSWVGLPMFVVDLRSAPAAGPVSDWLHRMQPQRFVGVGYSEGPESPRRQYTDIVPGQHYDVIFFVENTTAARPTPGCLERMAEYEAIEEYARQLETATTKPADGNE